MFAKSAGKTTLFIWDRYGKRSVTIRVFKEDLKLVYSRIKKLLAKIDIKGIDLEINDFEGRVVVSGEVSEGKMQDLEELLAPFEGSILNLVKEKEETDLIQIDAQVLEFSTSLVKTLGLEWTSALSYTETLPTGTIHELNDVFKLGKFSRSTAITSAINALISEGKGRVLSQPKLVCVSGKEASFLVGGEVPVTSTTTSSGGNVSTDVEFKSYGVDLSVSPTLRDDGKIDIDLNINISDVDPANAAGGNTAFTNRTAQTKLFLEDGQTVVLAGLIKVNDSKTITRLPFFSDIPVVGALFRRTSTSKPTTELAVTLTPTIIGSSKEKLALLSEMYAGQQAYDKDVVFSEGLGEPKAAPYKRSSPSVISRSAIETKTYIPEDAVSYIRSVQERIANTVVYPEMAKQYGWEGTVKIGLFILQDGTLATALVKESSGYEVFDEHALSTAKNSAPYRDFPSETDLKELNVTIPIVYSLKKRN